MATKIKIISAREFLEITPNGIINFITSKQLLVDIAKSEYSKVDHELLVDLRETQNQLSITDVYQLAAELCNYDNTFRSKVAIIVSSGVNFDQACFFETCSLNQGFLVNAFTDYEKAIRWIL